jgi:hypothetical protein
MYFLLFISVILILKAAVGMIWYQNDVNFKYYDNISNICIGIALIGCMMMNVPKSVSLPASVFTTPNVSSVNSLTPSISDSSERTTN